MLNQLFLSAYGLYLTHMHSVELTLDIVPCSYQMGRVQQTLIPTQLLSVQLFKHNFESRFTEPRTREQMWEKHAFSAVMNRFPIVNLLREIIKITGLKK